MSQIIGVSEVAFGLGSSVGYATNSLAIRHRTKKERSIIDSYGPVGNNEVNKIPESRFRKAVSFLSEKIAPAIILGVAGGILPIAFLNSPLNNNEKPTLQVVYDASGQMAYDGSFAREQVINQHLINNSKMFVNITLARGGSFQENNITPPEFSKYSSIGSDSMPIAFQAALDTANSAVVPEQSNIIGFKAPENKAVLVVTDGNSIGDSSSIIAEAKHDHERIYIANVSNNDQDANSLQEIAQQTGGQYWEAGSNQTINTIASQINQTLTPIGDNLKINETNRNLLKIFDISLFLAFGGLLIKSSDLVWKRQEI